MICSNVRSLHSNHSKFVNQTHSVNVWLLTLQHSNQQSLNSCHWSGAACDVMPGHKALIVSISGIIRKKFLLESYEALIAKELSAGKGEELLLSMPGSLYHANIEVNYYITYIISDEIYILVCDINSCASSLILK